MFLNVAWMRMQKHSKTSACSGCFKKKKKTISQTGEHHGQCGYGTSTVPAPSVFLSMLSAVFLCFVCSVRSPRSCVSYIMYRNSYSYIIARTTLLILLAATSPALFASYSETSTNYCPPPDRAPLPSFFNPTGGTRGRPNLIPSRA